MHGQLSNGAAATASEEVPSSAENSLLEPRELVLDDIINSLGWGLWTGLYFLLATFVPMSMMGNLLISEFTAEEISYNCSRGTLESYPNETSSLLLNSSQSAPSAFITAFTEAFTEPTTALVTEATTVKPLPLGNECYKPFNSSYDVDAEPSLCTEFEYDTSVFTNTITTEFDLVCSKEYIRSLYQILFTVGCLIGAPIGGITADKFGRLKCLWYSSLCMMALTVVLLAVPILWVVLLVRFLLGIVTDIVFLSAITLGMEVSPKSLRWLFASVESLPYAIMLPVLGGIAFLCRDWRLIQAWASVPLLLSTVLACPLFLDESPRWLVSKGLLEEAEKTIARAARLNGASDKLPEDWNLIISRQYKAQQTKDSFVEVPLSAHLWSLISTTEMRTVTLTLTAMWLIEGTLYISLPLEASTYGSPFLYMALLGLPELPGTLIITPLGGKFGRKRVGFVCAIITANLLAAMALLKGLQVQREWILVAMAIVAYVALVGVSQMTILLTAELFPTTVRSLGSSFGFFMNNVGYCIPPLLELFLEPDKPYIILGTYSVMALLNAGLLLLLPETSGRSLLETVAEHVQRERERKTTAKPTPV